MNSIKFLIVFISIFWAFRGGFSIGPFSSGGTPGTIFDASTGLTWTQCSMGQAATAPCAGAPTTSAWSTALNYCNTLTTGGFVWRLPNIKEMYTIVNFASEAPSISTTSFPNTPNASDSYYWTSTTHPSPDGSGGRNRAMIVDFREGGSDDNLKTGLHYVRCVTGP
ncbi:hypothetical protein A0128_05400 [Leptospira tipperaryensis]|uniref:Lcl C-terminal domain-containing protein n=1 Tax=Leptospira tipperaryensis TaxID=2564040 RepID=A0A1D7UUP5_9LEPT|nr:DUF1566 domain-containing protein [Leptospira tipperaryensis]AOP33330.1 hypothetical protein A0128_05400 [Leptospira tipperaryensis]